MSDKNPIQSEVGNRISSDSQMSRKMKWSHPMRSEILNLLDFNSDSELRQFLCVFTKAPSNLLDADGEVVYPSRDAKVARVECRNQTILSDLSSGMETRYVYRWEKGNEPKPKFMTRRFEPFGVVDGVDAVIDNQTGLLWTQNMKIFSSLVVDTDHTDVKLPQEGEWCLPRLVELSNLYPKTGEEVPFLKAFAGTEIPIHLDGETFYPIESVAKKGLTDVANHPTELFTRRVFSHAPLKIDKVVANQYRFIKIGEFKGVQAVVDTQTRLIWELDCSEFSEGSPVLVSVKSPVKRESEPAHPECDATQIRMRQDRLAVLFEKRKSALELLEKAQSEFDRISAEIATEMCADQGRG